MKALLLNSLEEVFIHSASAPDQSVATRLPGLHYVGARILSHLSSLLPYLSPPPPPPDSGPCFSLPLSVSPEFPRPHPECPLEEILLDGKALPATEKPPEGRYSSLPSFLPSFLSSFCLLSFLRQEGRKKERTWKRRTIRGSRRGRKGLVDDDQSTCMACMAMPPRTPSDLDSLGCGNLSFSTSPVKDTGPVSRPLL